MAVSKSKIGIYSIAGILAAVLIAVSFVVAAPQLGIQLPTNNQSGQQGNNQQKVGTLVVSLKDAPAEMKSLMLTVSAIYIQDPTEGEEDNWKLLPFVDEQTEVTFDLLQYKDISLEVAETELNAGTYHKVRLEITSAIAVYEDDENPDTDEEVELKVPPGHIDIIVDLTIEEGAVTTLVIDIEPDAVQINKNNIFRPVIKATATTSNGDTLQATNESPNPTEEPTETPTPPPTESPTPTATA